MFKKKVRQVSPLADLFLNSSAQEKKAIYNRVLDIAIQEQREMIAKSKEPVSSQVQ